MGATYTRQSSSAIVDGAVIEAADINAEFDQILAAFAVTSGHTHDGTAAEGGPITKLLGTAITIGDGVLTWMEDEDYFQFSDDLLLTTTEKLQFRDTAIYINSSADGQLDLVADTEIQIAATTIDINGAVDISGALTLAGTTLAETIADTVGAMVTSNTETNVTVTYDDSDNTLDFVVSSSLDTTGNAATATALETARTIGGTSFDGTANIAVALSATATALATARTIHGVSFDGTANIDLSEVISDTVGAMVTSNTESGITVAYQDADNTLDFTIGTLNQDTTGTAATVTGAAQSNITSLGTLTTLTVDNIIVNGTTIGHTDDTDLITLADGIATVAGEVSMTTLDIGGTNISATAAEINLIDGDTARGTTAVVDADGILHNDGGTMRMTSAATFKTYFTSGVSSAADDLTAGDAAVNITTSSGDITIDAAANDSDIIFKGTDATADITMLTLDGSEAGAATFNDKVIATELDISGNCDIDGTTNLDAVDIDGAVQLDATLTIGANDQGYDVILYGDTASANITWDTSADDLIFNGAAGLIIPDGQLTLGSTAVTSTAAELNLLDGVSGLVQADLTKLAAVDSTAAELNIVDGDTSATSTTVADADRVVLNDNGTMVQVAMTDIKTYIGGGTQWQAVKTGNYTASAGEGVFMNTTSSALTLTLPAGSIGDEVTFVDYAGTFDTNNLTIAANGSEKIHGSTDDLTVAVERAANTLVFTDSTQGWLLKSK
jgi:hypothetical protein